MRDRRSLALAVGLAALAGLAGLVPVPSPSPPRNLRIDVRGERLLLGRSPRDADGLRPLAPRPERPCVGTLRRARSGGVLVMTLPATPVTTPLLVREGVPGGRPLDGDWTEGAWSCRRRPGDAPWSVELAEPPAACRWTVVLPPPTSGTAVLSFLTTEGPDAGFRVSPGLDLVVTLGGPSPGARSPLGDLTFVDEVTALAAGACRALPGTLGLAALAVGAGPWCPARRLLRHPLVSLALTLLVLLPALPAAGSALLVMLVWWGLAAGAEGPLPPGRVLALTVPALALALLHPLPGAALLVIAAAAVASRPGEDRPALRGLALVAGTAALAVVALHLVAPATAADVLAGLRACGFTRTPVPSVPWGEPGFGASRALANLGEALTGLAGTLGPGLALWPLGLVLLGARSPGDVVLPLAAGLTLLAGAVAWRPDLLPTCVLAVLAATRAVLLIATRTDGETP